MEEDARRLGPRSHSSTFLPSPLRGVLLLLDPSLVPTASHPWSKSHRYLLPRLHSSCNGVPAFSWSGPCSLLQFGCFPRRQSFHQSSQLSLQHSFLMGPKKLTTSQQDPSSFRARPLLISSLSSPFPALKLNTSSFLSELIPSGISALSSEATFTEEPSLAAPSFPRPL